MRMRLFLTSCCDLVTILLMGNTVLADLRINVVRPPALGIVLELVV